MILSFKILWLIWFGGVVYDCAAVGFGIFPSHTPLERVTTDASIAWFIFSVWSIVALNRYLNRNGSK